MKYKIQPTDNEIRMRENDFIVSKTDLKGRITYGNRTFIEFSGYTEAELLGAPHNLIRHPDMPRGVFKFLWDTLEQKRECFAYVKNLTKTGSFYWVFANITPSHNARGQVDGYYSVRRAPKPAAITKIAAIYKLMLAEEQRAGVRSACDASLELLSKTLADQGLSYEEFILAL